MKLTRLKRLLVALPAVACMSAAAQIVPISQNVEHLDENILINVPESANENPRFSWVNNAPSSAVGVKQKAYQIRVATDSSALVAGKADVWDSRKVKSEDSYLVTYKGPQLKEATDYWWSVRVWGSEGGASGWSTPQRFTTGLKPASWKAQWIGAPWEDESPQRDLKTGKVKKATPVPYLRKAFNVKSSIRSAKVFVTGLGYFELFINGSKVSQDLLVPNFTNYTFRPDIRNYGISLDDKSAGYRVSYLKYDITSMLRAGGKNAVGAMVGAGYYDARDFRIGPFGSRRFICQIEIDYTDGSHETVVSDPTWKAAESPIIFSDLHEGEFYDARKEIAGWCTPGFDDSSWANAVARKAPDGKLTAFDTHPDRITEVIKPKSCTKNADGSYTLDFGKLVSGHVHITGVRGEAGKEMKILYHSVYPQEVSYTFRDGEPIDYAPQFTWFVFNKVTIRGVEPKAENVLAEVVNTDMKINSKFFCSNALFNRISEIWQQAEIDNIHSGVESDCPHRERVPYTGDGQSVCATVMHNFNSAAFHRSWIRTMRETQDKETGYEPNSAPWCVAAGGGVAWGAGMTLMPWEYYMSYGDRRALEENYEAAKHQVEYMLTWVNDKGIMLQERRNVSDGNICDWFNLGDWVESVKLPEKQKVHTYILWRCADRMSQMAKAMGKKDDEQRFRQLADRTAEAYDRNFFVGDTLGYGDYGCNVFAVDMGLLEKRPELKNILAEEIGKRYKGHLNVGFVALEHFFTSLAKAGLNDLAYEAMNQRDYPSFGYWIDKGATTFWEQFNCENSEDHPFLGNCLTWFYRDLAGINADPAEPAYKHLIVRPKLATNLYEVSYAKESPYGRVGCQINHSAERVRLLVQVPVGSHSTIYVPAAGFSKLMVNGTPAAKAKGVTSVKSTAEGFTLTTLQGNYDVVATK